MGFHIGFVVLWDARWVTITDGRLVARYYVRTATFFINLVAMLPAFLQASRGRRANHGVLCFGPLM